MLTEDCVAWPQISLNEQVQTSYQLMRQNGESHSIAEMLATRSFPGVKGTDSVFMQGRKLGGQQFEDTAPNVGEHHMAMAAKAGVNTSGKWYSGTMAEFPGDPRAWVSGLGDVRRIAKERGIGVAGAVNIEPSKYGDGYVVPERYRVDDSLVAEHVDEVIGERPVSPRELDEIKATVTQRLSGVHGL